jgi:hypothetical protein
MAEILRHGLLVLHQLEAVVALVLLELLLQQLLMAAMAATELLQPF